MRTVVAWLKAEWPRITLTIVFVVGLTLLLGVGLLTYDAERKDEDPKALITVWDHHIKFQVSDSLVGYIGFYDGKIDYRGSLEVTDAARIFFNEASYFMDQETRTNLERYEFETRELRSALRRCYAK